MLRSWQKRHQTQYQTHETNSEAKIPVRSVSQPERKSRIQTSPNFTARLSLVLFIYHFHLFLFHIFFGLQLVTFKCSTLATPTILWFKTTPANQARPNRELKISAQPQWAIRSSSSSISAALNECAQAPLKLLEKTQPLQRDMPPLQPIPHQHQHVVREPPASSSNMPTAAETSQPLDSALSLSHGRF